ncbi:Arogenate dehydratase 3 [Linum perenne]
MHGSTLRVAYQGVPGAYSEAAAGKAYPNCEAIPCDQFEVAFQAVELWIADRAVLPVENSLGFKTSIVFAHDKGTSVLFKVLSAFAFRNINLTKIESRPHRNRPIRLVDDANNVGTAKHFEYLFYVDFEASMAEVRAQNALAEVQEFTSFLRVLGSYPMDMTPWSPSSSSSS